MPEPVDPDLVAYMSPVIDGYSRQMALTGAALGQAVLFLTIVADRHDAPHDSPIRDAARDLRDAQHIIGHAMVATSNALNTLTREQENPS